MKLSLGFLGSESAYPRLARNGVRALPALDLDDDAPTQLLPSTRAGIGGAHASHAPAASARPQPFVTINTRSPLAEGTRIQRSRLAASK
jgi:hypothetical protein